MYPAAAASSIVAPEGAAAAAALLFQPHALDGHNTVHGLAHVVDGQGGDADGGEGFHLDAGAAENAHRRLDAKHRIAFECENYRSGRDGKWMAERDEFA